MSGGEDTSDDVSVPRQPGYTEHLTEDQEEWLAHERAAFDSGHRCQLIQTEASVVLQSEGDFQQRLRKPSKDKATGPMNDLCQCHNEFSKIVKQLDVLTNENWELKQNVAQLTKGMDTVVNILQSWRSLEPVGISDSFAQALETTSLLPQNTPNNTISNTLQTPSMEAISPVEEEDMFIIETRQTDGEDISFADTREQENLSPIPESCANTTEEHETDCLEPLTYADTQTFNTCELDTAPLYQRRTPETQTCEPVTPTTHVDRHHFGLGTVSTPKFASSTLPLSLEVHKNTHDVTLFCQPGQTYTIKSSKDMVNIPREAEVRIQSIELSRLATMTSSKGNFAWKVASQVYSRHELLGRNWYGNKGKLPLSPRRRHAIHHAVGERFGTEASTMKSAVDAINTGIRNIKYKAQFRPEREPLAALLQRN